MATAAELRAADALAIALERESLLLVGALFQSFAPGSTVPFTQRSIETTVREGLLASVGKLWSPTVNFLRLSTDTPKSEKLKMVELRWPEVYERNRAIAEKMLRFQTIQPLADAGTLLNDVVTKQVDETQTMIGYQKGIKWKRHTDAKACDWCRDQVSAYSSTGSWFRHANCKCFKVKEIG